jgi:pimeloyl-ACP methyl ester carboxylesterase
MIVDVVRAESSRFRHPLLLLHGLWTGGWIWRHFAAYLAHRGWDAWVPSLLEDASLSDVNGRQHALIDLCRTLPAPPVLISHDAGVAMATLLASEVAAPAIVAIAPLLPRIDRHVNLGVLAHPKFWPARLWARSVPPPRGRIARSLMAGLDDEAVGRLRPDSGAYLRALLAGTFTLANPSQPGLVIASSNDDITSREQSRRLADRWRWSFDLHETYGHFPMLTSGSEGLADHVHRWLVRAIGADLLAWLEDDEDAD